MSFIFSSCGLDSEVRKEDAVESTKNQLHTYKEFHRQPDESLLKNLSIPRYENF
jgi:hypothetical protein